MGVLLLKELRGVLSDAGNFVLELGLEEAGRAGNLKFIGNDSIYVLFLK